MAVYEKASGEYPMNAGFYGAPGIAGDFPREPHL